MALRVCLLMVSVLGVTFAAGKTARDKQEVKIASGRNIAKRQETPDYVTRSEFSDAINDIMATVSSLATDVSQNTATLSQVTQDLSQAVADVSVLQDNYDYHTVRQCQSGVVSNACQSGSCNDGYVENRVSFSPPFHKNPRAIASFVFFDDSGTQIRVESRVFVQSKEEMLISLSTWSGSKVSSPEIQWMACA